MLQAADILLYKAGTVPVGEDQLAHLELTREIVRRFNGIYGDILVEPHSMLTKTPRIQGLDNRKMSKSYDNFIALKDSPESIRKKVARMITDPQRIKKTDPGHPEVCNVHAYFGLFKPSMKKEVDGYCRKALKGCTECKAILADIIIERLKEIREKRQALLEDNAGITGILEEGTHRAKEIAAKTMAEVKKSVGMIS